MTNPAPAPEKPKRFLLFVYDTYYPAGGWDDLFGSYDTFEEARAARPDRGDYGEIVDLDTGATTLVDPDRTTHT